ncbi:hypothetical protein BCR33DRAFT_785283 [Rhizoclosmatium globosum]|uniref:Uncharacterized protein n=1 Tax=Rhizoclosmatium globosum TaxID=329046 RepID=A0A1Y2CAG3_9FUNG|nr:hypothetical protein BCR33DRAFT_785283 [Rhizoclosmatium globosum]|eukprot:ORY44028.1 hypothetical protein BCR33DRAFT_785283 [Rhizoclosmatium globosum]
MSYRSYPISGPPALVLKNKTVIAADPEYADRYNAIESATDIDQRVAITLASLQLVILGCLIWKERRHLPHKKHKFFTVINSLLAAMIIAHGLNPFFDLLRTQVEDVDPKVAPVMTLSSLSAFFQFLLNFLVMVYAWKRGHPVIQLLRPSIQPYMITMLIFFAFLLLSQFIATVLDTYVLSYTDTLDKPEKLRTLCTLYTRVLGMKWALMVEDQRRDVAKFDRVANAKQLVSDKNYSLEKKVAEKSVGLSVSDNATV